MQKFDFSILLLIISVFVLVVISSCKKEESLGEEYTIPIDSIVHPDTIAVGEKLSIQYFGVLGLSKCFSFYRFDIKFDNDIINTTAVGIYVADDDCKLEISYLNGEEAGVYDLPEGDYSILVNLPRNNFFETKVHVKSKTN